MKITVFDKDFDKLEDRMTRLYGPVNIFDSGVDGCELLVGYPLLPTFQFYENRHYLTMIQVEIIKK